jgi:hypothetical protein
MVLGTKWAMADSRTDSLGLTAGQQVDDLDSIWLFPQDAANFGNVVDTRLGSAAATKSVANDWIGEISQEWPDVGYIGVYTKRPFNASNGVVPSFDPTDQYGIFNSVGGSWTNALNPLAAGSGAKVATTIGITSTASYTNFALSQAIADPENKLDAFWAKAYNDVTLGVHLNYADQGTTISSTTGSVNPPAAGVIVGNNNNGTDQVLGLDLGLGVKNVFFDSLNVSLGYSMGALNYSQQTNVENSSQNGSVDEVNQTEKDNGISEFRLNGLGTSKISDTTNGRLYLNVRLDNLGINSTQVVTLPNGNQDNLVATELSQSNTYSDTNLNLGYALNHKLADGKSMVITSLTAIYDDRQWSATEATNAAGSTSPNQLMANAGETEEETTLVIPFNVAVETPLFDWMKLRFGAYKNLYQSITDKIVQPTNINSAGTAFQTSNVGQETQDLTGGINTYMGVGCAFNNFTLDLQINPNTLLATLGGIAPGQGILYGATATNPATGTNSSTLSQLYSTVAQMDMRFAF